MPGTPPKEQTSVQMPLLTQAWTVPHAPRGAHVFLQLLGIKMRRRGGGTCGCPGSEGTRKRPESDRPAPATRPLTQHSAPLGLPAWAQLPSELRGKLPNPRPAPQPWVTTTLGLPFLPVPGLLCRRGNAQPAPAAGSHTSVRGVAVSAMTTRGAMSIFSPVLWSPL